MHVYTPLPFLSVSAAGFVGDAVFGAGNGGFGLAIQDNCSVQAGSPCLVLLARTEDGDGVPVNVKGKANMPSQHNS
jgi:hypothetical protein